MPPSSHDAARELFSSGRLAEAELAWRRILERSPADPEALHTLGWILAQTGREPEGLALIDRSIDCEPRNAAMRGNRAAVLHSLGRDEEALRDLRRALDLDARLPAPLNLLGNIHLAAGRLDEARAAYRRALALDASMPEAHVGLGLVHVRHDDPAGARACFEAALGLDPGHAPAHFNLGVLCEAQGDDKRAERSYRLALERTPDDWQSLNNLGVLLRRTGREPEARDCLERALAAAPRQPDVLNNAGLSLQRAGRAQEAIARYELAVGQRPGFAHALVNWGNALQDLGSLDDARTRYEQAASASPGFPEARYGLAQVALRQRRFREGWELYEARFETRPPLSLRRELPLPRLEAGDLGRARRVAVWSEQGLGDQLLYSTLLGELERRGIGAVVEVDARLAPAYRRALPGMQFTIPAESAQAFLGCDFQVPIASLPRLFRNETADFARQPRALLTADPGRLAAARAALGPGRWIGIAWRSLQGGEREPVARRKSAPLEAFAELAVAGVRLLDLQYGELREERDAFEEGHRGLLTRIAQLDVFADIEGVLAAIAACEGVVTTSNVLAHLAGALGAPTRLIYLAGREPFHYWVPGADGRSPWYPSVEIVTDQAWTSWEPVLVAVASRLR